jgi:hypothetical protein
MKYAWKFAYRLGVRLPRVSAACSFAGQSRWDSVHCMRGTASHNIRVLPVQVDLWTCIRSHDICVLPVQVDLQVSVEGDCLLQF